MNVCTKTHCGEVFRQARRHLRNAILLIALPLLLSGCFLTKSLIYSMQPRPLQRVWGSADAGGVALYAQANVRVPTKSQHASIFLKFDGKLIDPSHGLASEPTRGFVGEPEDMRTWKHWEYVRFPGVAPEAPTYLVIPSDVLSAEEFRAFAAQMQSGHRAMLAAWDAFELREGQGIGWTQMWPMKNLVGLVRADDLAFFSADGMRSVNIRPSNGVEVIHHHKPYTGWQSRSSSSGDRVEVGADGRLELHYSSWDLCRFGADALSQWVDRYGTRLGDRFRLISDPER